MKRTSVSIIVPVYNVGPYVEDCIRSVMRQTYDGEMECIIVDDCGTDDSMAIVERVIEDYNGPITFKILHHTHNRGLSAARNTGMDAATGEFLFFLDSDDELMDDCIKKLMAVALTDDAIEIVQGSARTVPERKSDYFDREINISHASTNKLVRICYYEERQMLPNAWNKIIRRSFVLHNNLFFKEGILLEDFLWNFYLLKYVKNVYFVPDLTYLYNARPGSIMRGTDKTIIDINYNIIYLEILMNLSSGFEHEELAYFVKKYHQQYIHNPQIYKDSFRLFWKQAWKYKNLFCCKLLAISFCSRYKWGRMLIYLMRRIKHPSLIMNNIKRKRLC